MNYVGEKCAACGEVFTAEDDVVVCPDCGSPHHRECYKKAGKCANESYHAEKKKWERQLNKDKVFVVCPICHFPNSKTDERCERCGFDLTADPGTAAPGEKNDNIYEPFSEVFDENMGQPRPYLGFDPDEDLGGATVREVSDFVKTNTLYYLPIFKRMKDIGSKLSFNLTCFFFPSLYFANRKMWGWAILAVVINVILNIPAAFIYMAEAGGMPEYIVSAIDANRQFLSQADVVCTMLDIGVKMMFCLLGNSLYFKYILRSLKKIREDGGDYMARKVAEMGGVKPANMVLITLIKAAVTFGIVMLAYYIYDVADFVNALDSSAVIGGFIR